MRQIPFIAVMAFLASITGAVATEGLLVVLRADDGQQSRHRVLVERDACLSVLDQVQASKRPGAEPMRLSLPDLTAEGVVIDAYCIDDNGTIIDSDGSARTQL